MHLRQLNVGRRRTFLTEEFEDVKRHARDGGDGRDFAQELRRPDKLPICRYK